MNEPNMNASNLPGNAPGHIPSPNPAVSAANAITLAPREAVPPVRSGVNGSYPMPLAYTVDEAAAALHVCPKTIRRLLARGILTSSKVLRKKLIPRSQIEGFLKATCDVPKTIH